MQDNKSKRYSIGWHVFVVLVIIAFGVWGSDKLTWTDQQPLLGTLQNTSSMVFAIAGIWMAYLYPEAISSIVKGRNTNDLTDKLNDDIDDIQRVRLIVGVIALSGFVMASLLAFSVIVPVVQKSPFFSAYPSIVRGIGLILLYSLTYIQLFAVYAVLASNVNFLIRLVNLETKIRLDRKLNPLKGKLRRQSSNDDNNSD
ncbi:hypothetical protein JYB88_12360 [Shewanella cyperi]|uniref:Uncharacterized protein n=1 Tax=Shewanella cyperi TaxID=2814292 RepID=A0A975AJG0_9GAMM|nr:hypothetical protein [Shewanella cyperi]QSX29040.1 hypothetical protein JYB88_12360 [Shewanella cyperi]